MAYIKTFAQTLYVDNSQMYALYVGFPLQVWTPQWRQKTLSALRSNFKNVPFTVAKRQQHLLCASLNFFETSPEFGPGKYSYFNPLTGEAVISRLGGVLVFKNSL